MMEVILKNVDPKDFPLLKELSQRLGIEVEAKPATEVEPPDNLSIADDLREAIAEIRNARVNNVNLQSARDLVDEL